MIPAPEDPPARPRWWWPACGALLVMLLLPWWRNHRYVLDFFDWSVVVAGAGKLRAGLQPYVDFSTPLQSVTLRIDALAERVFGERWLALTYANAVFIALAFPALAAVWRRVLPRGEALLVAAALVMCSAGQHTLFWHNPLGLVCLALVLGVATVLATGQRAGAVLLSLGAAALWAGGMNKLNFHGAALGLAGVVLACGWLLGRVSFGRLALLFAGLMVFGLVLPPLTEIGLSGAPWRLWWLNVFELPVGRIGLLQAAAHPGFYFQPPADFYWPLWLRPTGAIVLGVGLVVGVLYWRARRGAGRWRDRLLVAVVAGAGVACTIALMATNVEMVLVSAVAVVAVLAMLSGLFGDGADRGSRRAGLAVAVVFLAAGWHSAWGGARVFYGAHNVDRAAFVSAADLPPSFAYLRGMRVLPDRLAALQALAAELAQPEASALRKATWATGGAEWLERTGLVRPLRRLPLWLHFGDSIREEDVWRYIGRFRVGGDIARIIVDNNWNFWCGRLQMFLAERYARRTVGARFFVYDRQPGDRIFFADPLKFSNQAITNVRNDRWVPEAGEWWPRTAAAGTFVGCTGSSAMRLDLVSYRLRGQAVARWFGEPLTAPVRGWARVTAPLEQGRQVLWERQFVFSSAFPDFLEDFAVDPGGRPVRLEWEFDGGEVPVDAGWRGVLCTHSGPLDALAPAPLLVRGGAAGTVAPPPALFRPGCGPAQLAWVGPEAPHATTPEPGGLRTRLDSEIWFPIDRAATRLHGIWVFKNRGQPAKVRVMWQKSGRIETLQDTVLYGPEPDPGLLWDCALPEPVGWIGLIVTRREGDPRDAVIEWRDLWWE